MDVYLNICAEYNDKRVKNCEELINESVGNHGLFQGEVSSVVDSHLKEINVLLQSSKTRNQGFQLLLPLIQQGSPDLIEKRSELWFGNCCQSITSLSGASERINACRIITFLLKAFAILPEVQKSFLTKSHASLIQNLAIADSSWNIAALECLYELVKLIPGQCLPQKVVIEENMLKYLDTPLTRVGQDDAVKRAGQVFAALPLPGMGGNKVQGRAEARGRQLTQLIALAHRTMDVLFEGIVEKETYKHPRNSNLKINSISLGGKKSADTVQGFFAAVTRLGNILKFISQMLTSESNESISLVPQHLLGPLFRLLQVDSTILKSYRSQEHQLLSFLIMSLHHHCLLLLRDLVISVGESIDLYFGVIGDLLTAVIRMSFTEDGPAWCASGIQTRIIAYAVLATVIQRSGGKHAPSKELVNLMLKDILPKKQQVTLQKFQNKGLQSLMVQKKKKKKGYAIGQNDALTHSGPLFQSDTLCHVTRSALSLAETLFACASHSLPYKAKQILQMNVMKVAEAVTGGATLPEAYVRGKTRAQMYRSLASIATHPDPRCPPPYTVLLHLLQRGQQDQEILVVTTCQALMGSLSFILANPQISLLAVAHDQSQKHKGQDMEEEDENTQPEIRFGHSQEESENEDNDVEEVSIGDEDMEDEDDEDVEEEVNEDVEEEDDEDVEGEVDEDMEEDVEEVAVTENAVQKEHSEEVEENGIDGDDTTEEEDGKNSDDDNDVEEVEEAENSNDSNDVEEAEEAENCNDSNGVEEIHEEDENDNKDDSVKATVELEREGKATVPERVAPEVSSSAKRKMEEVSPVDSENSKTKASKKSSDEGPSLEEMLESFVDADPDDP